MFSCWQSLVVWIVISCFDVSDLKMNVWNLIFQVEPRTVRRFEFFVLATPKFRLEFHRAARTLSEGTDVEVDAGSLVVKGLRTWQIAQMFLEAKG